jgi:hypothetical protein
MQELLNDVANQSALLPTAVAAHVNETLAQLADSLGSLNRGVSGPKRREIERKFDEQMRTLQAELRGEEAVASDYCGSCYGASPDPNKCAHTHARQLRLHAARMPVLVLVRERSSPPRRAPPRRAPPRPA